MCRWISQHEHREDNHFLQKCHPQRASLQSKSSTVSQTDSGCQSTFSQPPSACSMGSCPNQPWSHGWRINSNDFANHTTKNTLPSKALIQIQWRDQKFIDKQKLREFITTQTRFTTNAQRTSLGGKETRSLQEPCTLIDCCIKTSWEHQTKKYSKYTQKEKQPKLNTMYGHQIKREQNKTKDLQNKPKTIKKMSILVIINTLNK